MLETTVRGKPTCLCFDDRDEHVGVGFTDGSVCVYSLAEQKGASAVLPSYPHTVVNILEKPGQGPVFGLSFLPSLGLDAPPVVAVWCGKTIDCWNAKQKTVVKSSMFVHTTENGKKLLHFSPCGRGLIAICDRLMNV